MSKRRKSKHRHKKSKQDNNKQDRIQESDKKYEKHSHYHHHSDQQPELICLATQAQSDSSRQHDNTAIAYTLPTTKIRNLPPLPRDVTCLPTEAAVIRRRRRLPSYCKLVLMPMFAAMSKITDHLYLTSIGGMTQENFEKYKIRCIINATFEAPNLKKKGIESIRVPVDDSPNDDIQEFFDQVADIIHEKTVQNLNVVVHCVAGVSRSTSLVLAYLMKYHKMDLHSAFSYIQTRRPIVRPNNGFFKQLLNYELKLLGKNSFKMVRIDANGVNIEVPDFFQTEYKGFIVLESLKMKAKMESLKKKKDDSKSISSLTDNGSPSKSPEEAQAIADLEKTANEESKKEQLKEDLLKRYVVDQQTGELDAEVIGEQIVPNDKKEDKK